MINTDGKERAACPAGFCQEVQKVVKKVQELKIRP
jgi:hypothetical protein